MKQDRNACYLPRTVEPKEADLYRKIREVHCDQRKKKDHPCAGTVTLAPGHMLLQCPLCGDFKGIIK